MKPIRMIKETMEEVNKLEPSKHRKMAYEHLKKAIVQIRIGERKKKILEKPRGRK